MLKVLRRKKQESFGGAEQSFACAHSYRTSCTHQGRIVYGQSFSWRNPAWTLILLQRLSVNPGDSTTPSCERGREGLAAWNQGRCARYSSVSQGGRQCDRAAGLLPNRWSRTKPELLAPRCVDPENRLIDCPKYFGDRSIGVTTPRGQLQLWAPNLLSTSFAYHRLAVALQATDELFRSLQEEFLPSRRSCGSARCARLCQRVQARRPALAIDLWHACLLEWACNALVEKRPPSRLLPLNP